MQIKRTYASGINLEYNSHNPTILYLLVVRAIIGYNNCFEYNYGSNPTRFFLHVRLLKIIALASFES